MLSYFLDVCYVSPQKPVVLQTILPCFVTAKSSTIEGFSFSEKTLVKFQLAINERFSTIEEFQCTLFFIVELKISFLILSN